MNSWHIHGRTRSMNPNTCINGLSLRFTNFIVESIKSDRVFRIVADYLSVRLFAWINASSLETGNLQ